MATPTEVEMAKAKPYRVELSSGRLDAKRSTTMPRAMARTNLWSATVHISLHVACEVAAMTVITES